MSTDPFKRYKEKYFYDKGLNTLKQTHKEKGRVTMTISHEKAVRSQPQTPMPTSESPAEKNVKKLLIKNV